MPAPSLCPALVREPGAVVVTSTVVASAAFGGTPKAVTTTSTPVHEGNGTSLVDSDFTAGVHS